MIATKPVPSLEDLIKLIEEAGSDDTAFFGFPEKADGLYLQQDAEEFASFVHFVARKLPPAKLSLDIGVASGGQTKFLRDYFPAEKTIVVDIGLHPNFVHWERIKPLVNSELVLEIIQDSHAPEVAERLAPFSGKIDFAYVDGDHSYRGLRKDIFLVRKLLRPGGYMVLHDTLAVPDCKRVHDELLKSDAFGLIRNFGLRFGISIWRMNKPLKRTLRLANRFGIGRI